MNDHPQDVVVPSLPEPYDYVYGWSSGHRSLSHSYWNGVGPYTSDPVFTAAQMRSYARAAVIADRAAGRASAEPEGLSLAQEPKYTVNGSAIVNRASGEVIPADEPVFIFRARDRHAVEVLEFYRDIVRDNKHREAIDKRTGHFYVFRNSHPERMKEPDTAPTPTASIAPKAEGEAVNLAGDFVEHSHPQFGGGYFCTPDVFARIEAHAAPVAQAAAGASEPIRKLLAEVLLFFHDCSESIRCIDRVVDLEERIGDALAPRPEADADRASGGGEGEGVKS